MKQLVLIFVLTTTILTTLFAKEESLSTINKKIEEAKKDLILHNKQQSKIKSTIDTLADEIIKHQKRIKKLTLTQKKLEIEIAALSKDSKEKEREIVVLKKRKKELLETKRDIEIQIIDLMSSSIAKSLIIEKTKEVTTKDIIQKEIFEKVKEQTDKKINAIKKDFINSQKELESLDNRLAKIEQSLQSLREKQHEIVAVKKEEKQEVATLSKKQNNYSGELEKIVSQKKEERKLLADLDIIKSKTIQKVKAKEEQERERLAKQRGKQSNTKVKRYGSSYLAAGNQHYKGRKYKAPLDDRYAFKVTKKFGPYVDPIYNIKIHNDYITLKAEKSNTVVRSVMNGKVIYADNLQTLGHVVIVKHSNNMHTIYRNLNEISPNVKVNSTIRAREAVGRVRNELVFEVTKEGIPINPLELIAVPKNYIL